MVIVERWSLLRGDFLVGRNQKCFLLRQVDFIQRWSLTKGGLHWICWFHEVTWKCKVACVYNHNACCNDNLNTLKNQARCQENVNVTSKTSPQSYKHWEAEVNNTSNFSMNHTKCFSIQIGMGFFSDILGNPGVSYAYKVHYRWQGNLCKDI